MESLLRDLRYGVRGLMKRPGFAITVILTLAVGIGASTTIFTVLNSVMLRRLPYRTADRIVVNKPAGIAAIPRPNVRQLLRRLRNWTTARTSLHCIRRTGGSRTDRGSQ